MATKKLYSAYTSFDLLFGTRPELNIKQSSKHKTPCGSTLTILLIAFCIANIITASSDYIRKENPNVSLSEQILDKAGTITFGPEQDFNLAFSLIDPVYFANFADPSIYYAKAEYLIFPEVAGTEPPQIIDLDMEICTEESAGLLTTIIGNAWCIKKKQSKLD